MILNGALGKYRCACGLVFPNSQQKASHCKHCETHKLRKAEQIARAVETAALSSRVPLSKAESWCVGLQQAVGSRAMLRPDAIAAALAYRPSSLSAESPDAPSAKRRRLSDMAGDYGDRPTLDTVVSGVNSGRVRKVVLVIGTGVVSDSRADVKGGDGRPHPTAAHMLARLMHDRGLLLRVYTANFDNLERASGIPASLVVPVHESARNATCTSCGAQFTSAELRAASMRCKYCGSAVRPGFSELLEQDLACCDSLMFLGANVSVAPMPGIFNNAMLSPESIRVVIGQPYGESSLLCSFRDVELSGSVQLECSKIVSKLGWKRDLRALATRYTEQCRLQGIPVPGPFNPQYTVGEVVYVMAEGSSWDQGVIEEVLEMPFSQCYYRVGLLGRGNEYDTFVTAQRICPFKMASPQPPNANVTVTPPTTLQMPPPFGMSLCPSVPLPCTAIPSPVGAAPSLSIASLQLPPLPMQLPQSEMPAKRMAIGFLLDS